MKEKLNKELNYMLSHPCELTSTEINNLEDYFEIVEKFGTPSGFAIFFKAFRDSKCHSYTLHDLNNELLFPSSILGESDKRLWVNFAISHFDQLPVSDRSWDYKTLEDYMTCEQKRILLTKYKKDIDTFDDMVVPECR